MASTWMMILDVLIRVLILLEQTKSVTSWRSKYSSNRMRSDVFRLIRSNL